MPLEIDGNKVNVLKNGILTLTNEQTQDREIYGINAHNKVVNTSIENIFSNSGLLVKGFNLKAIGSNTALTIKIFNTKTSKLVQYNTMELQNNLFLNNHDMPQYIKNFLITIKNRLEIPITTQPQQRVIVTQKKPIHIECVMCADMRSAVPLTRCYSCNKATITNTNIPTVEKYNSLISAISAINKHTLNGLIAKPTLVWGKNSVYQISILSTAHAIVSCAIDQ
jgi:hypothetical protein